MRKMKHGEDEEKSEEEDLPFNHFNHSRSPLKLKVYPLSLWLEY